MAKVPTYTRQIEQAPVTGAKFSAPSDDGGLQVAAAGQRVAQALQGWQDAKDEADAKALDTEFAEFERSLLYDPKEGYFSKRGKDAVDARAEVEARLDEKAAELRGRAGGAGRLEKLYGGAIDQRLARARDNLARYGLEQTHAYQVESSEARVVSLGMDAAALSFDPNQMEVAIAAGKQELMDQGRLKGWGADIYALKAVEFESGVLSQALEAMRDDPLAAEAFFDANAHRMTPRAQAAFRSSIKEEAGRTEGFVLADAAAATAPTREKAYAMVAASGRSPRVQEAAEKRLDAVFAREDRLEKENVEDLLGGALARVAAGANPETDFTPTERAAHIKAGHWDDVVKAYKDGKPEKGGATYLALSLMAAQKPEAFRAAPLARYADQMTPEEFTGLLEVQRGRKEAEAKKYLPQVATAQGMLKTRMAAIGEDDEALLAQGQTWLLGRVMNAQKNDRPLTDADLKGMVDQAMLRDGGKFLFETAAGKRIVDDPAKWEAGRKALLAHSAGASSAQVSAAIDRYERTGELVPFDKVPAAFVAEKKKRGVTDPGRIAQDYARYLLDKSGEAAQP